MAQCSNSVVGGASGPNAGRTSCGHPICLKPSCSHWSSNADRLRQLAIIFYVFSARAYFEIGQTRRRRYARTRLASPPYPHSLAAGRGSLPSLGSRRRSETVFFRRVLGRISARVRESQTSIPAENSSEGGRILLLQLAQFRGLALLLWRGMMAAVFGTSRLRHRGYSGLQRAPRSEVEH